MSFHDRWPHITHMRWLCQQASGICSSHLRMLREKSYYKGPYFLWTSVVPLSPLLSILMPTSNCENPSCFRRKSILCGDPLPFSCIMFFAMKGSYKPKNVFGVFFFLMANSLCPPCSKKYNMTVMVTFYISSWNTSGLVWKSTTIEQWVYFHMRCLTMTIKKKNTLFRSCQFKQNTVCVMQISILSGGMSPNVHKLASTL